MDEVRHVARLARLRLSDDEIAAMRTELSTVLDHIATLQSLDVADVPEMSHPLDITNRLADDEPTEPMPVDALLANAPAARDRYIDVPKVLGTD